MNILKTAGQSTTITVILTSIIMSAGSWLINSVLSNPDKVSAQVTAVNTKLERLCTDYGLTVSRIDDNTQAIGRALKINVTSGRAGSNPCRE